jgi:hypothetical protein
LSFVFFPIKEGGEWKKRDVCLNALSAFAFGQKAVEHKQLIRILKDSKCFFADVEKKKVKKLIEHF